MNYGRQIGVIVYAPNVNARVFAQDAIARGFVVVWRSKFATIHERKR